MKKNYQLPKPTNPTISYCQAKAIFTADGRLEGYKKNMKITRNNFARKLIYERQHGICPYCGKRMLNINVGTAIHHNSYDNSCTFNGPLIHIYSPQPDGAIQIQVPNCAVCYYKYPCKSEDCISALVMIHKDCHELLHGHLEKVKTQD